MVARKYSIVLIGFLLFTGQRAVACKEFTLVLLRVVL